uniref:Uncharacterized protein n=1 Tax=Caenorhabditis japonica TaxID=281687 RepID=A0A8R1IC86_CAEJA
MRTMDQGQLQKMLNAAAVASTQNNMMLFSPIMTTTAITANQMTSSSSCSSSPMTTMTNTTTTLSTPPAIMWPSSLKPDSLEANLASVTTAFPQICVSSGAHFHDVLFNTP